MAVKPLNPDLGKGSNLTQFSFFFIFYFNQFSHSVFTKVKTSNSVFNQGIIHGNTLRRSDWDAWVMPKGICDTHPTLLPTYLFMTYLLTTNFFFNTSRNLTSQNG
jgi:hypothetical protein